MKIAIIGSGPGGYVAALHAAKLGADVTLVEKAKLGGVCLNWGCIPTKTLLSCTDLLHKARLAEEFGLDLQGEIRPNLQKMLTRKEKVVQASAKGIENMLQEAGVRYVQAEASLAAPGKLLLKESKNNSSELDFDKLILATGSVPSGLPGVEFDGQKILSSDQALQLKKVPSSMLIVGGGVIGCEFAFLFQRLGTKVTIVEAMDRLLPLPSIDSDCSKIILREMKKQKIGVILNRSLKSCTRKGNDLEIVLGPSPFTSEKQAEESEKRNEEVVLVCIGRQPNSSGLGLEIAGVETDSRGWIKADANMQTNVQDIYAIGDILGPPKVMLAHVASREARVAAENALGRNSRMDYGQIPSAIFTSPEVACVGMSEEQARGKGYAVDSESVLFRILGKAQAMGEISGQAKLVYEQDSGQVLGIHLVGAHATDLIAEGTLALHCSCSLEDLYEVIHAHPTLSEIMGEVTEKAMFKSGINGR